MTVHPRVCAHPVSFPVESPLPENLEAIRRLGFPWVGAHRNKLLAHGWEDGLDLLERSGLRVAYFVHREWFRLDRPDLWDEDTAALREVIDGAARFGAGLYGTTGPGPAIGLTWEQAAEAFIRAVQPAVAYAREKGVSLMLETAQPLFADYHFLHTLRDTIDVVEDAGLRLTYDVHPTWFERDLEALVRRGAPITDLVQLSDYSPGMRTMDRGIPGDGVMPLERILGWLLEEGYDGVFDLELWGDTGMTPEEGLARGAAWVGGALEPTRRLMHPRLSVNPSSFPGRMPFADVLAAVERLGVPAIDAPRVRLLHTGWDHGLALLERSPLAVTTFIHRSLVQLDRPETWEESTAAICETVDAAARFGSPVYGTTGPGPALGLTFEESTDRFCRAIAPSAAHARERGVLLMVETSQPMFADFNFLHTLRDTVDLAERAGLGVCLDVHGAWNERGLRETIARAGPRLGLVQLCDYSPGMRSMDRGAVRDGRDAARADHRLGARHRLPRPLRPRALGRLGNAGRGGDPPLGRARRRDSRTAGRLTLPRSRATGSCHHCPNPTAVSLGTRR